VTAVERSMADVVERLFREFEDGYALTVIVEVVRECCSQLCCSSPEAMPELVERLARQRLSATAAGAEDRPDAPAASLAD
jgi:hypothetical protein